MNQDMLFDFYRSFQFIISQLAFHNFASNADMSHTVATTEYTRCFIKKQPLLYFVISLHPKGRTV